MSNEIRHRSPKTQNNFFNNYYLKSQRKKDINIINLNNNTGQTSNKVQFNINYNNTNNYYEEISKAFNFITFILKKKDSQIKELKRKISDLEKQLNDINETNIMTFNNKDIGEIYSSEENQTFPYLNKTTNIKKLNLNYIPNKQNINKNISNEKNNMNNMNINILNRVKNSTNINKITNYRNKIDLNINKFNTNKITNTIPNNININKKINLNLDLNKNINEHSPEKKNININIIRKEPYHSNINIKYRNNSGNKFRNCQTNETDTSTGNNKIKIFNLSSMGRTSSKNSKSTSLTFSDEGIMKSKEEIKNYLKEIKHKIDHDKFKKFVELIKLLVKNKNTGQKNQIIFDIKNILIEQSLIDKFENILKIK